MNAMVKIYMRRDGRDLHGRDGHDLHGRDGHDLHVRDGRAQEEKTDTQI